MNLNEIARVLYVRRWVVAPVLLLTVVAAGLTFVRANSEFEATATLLLASPELGGSDQQASESASMFSASVVAEIVEGDSTRVRLGSGPSVTDYSVTVTPDRILQVEAKSATAAGVVSTADAVIDEIERVVEELKADFPEREVTFDVLSRPKLARERTVASESGETSVEFFASGSVLVDIAEVAGAEAFNPYTPSEGTLRVLAEVVAPERVRESIVTEIDDEAEFELIFDIRDVAPVLHVVASAISPEAAMDTLDAAVGFLEADLEERQTVAGADKSTFLWYQRLVYPDQAQVASGGLARPLATIIVLGVIAAISLAVLVDAVIAHRGKMRPPADDDHPKAVDPKKVSSPERKVFRKHLATTGGLSDAEIEQRPGAARKSAQAPRNPSSERSAESREAS